MALDLPATARMLVGGDFNSTVDPRLDRSHYRKNSDHGSPGLMALLDQWGLADVVTPPVERDERTVRKFYEQTHTYRYTLPDGAAASARLDRWYTSVDMWQGSTCATQARVPTIKQSDYIYPTRRTPSEFASRSECTRRRELRMNRSKRLAGGVSSTTAGRDPGRYSSRRCVGGSQAGDPEKSSANYQAATQDCSRDVQAEGRRLLRQERRLFEAAAGIAHSVETITDMMGAMSLQDGRGDTPLQRVRNAITDCLRGRMASRERRLFSRAGHRPGASSKQFFARISTKFGDNTMHRLEPAERREERGAHEQPNTMADGWTRIFQQDPGTEAHHLEILKWLGEPGQCSAELEDIMEPFTEAEVAAAIGSAKPGKACGPARLGNDWYRDFSRLLVPVLTILFNSWYPAGVTPPSFLEADIFCLKKGGAPQDPLNVFDRSHSWTQTTRYGLEFSPRG
jgi:hypothetical protein